MPGKRCRKCTNWVQQPFNTCNLPRNLSKSLQIQRCAGLSLSYERQLFQPLCLFDSWTGQHTWPLPLLPPSTLSWMNELVPRARCNVRLAFEGPVVHYMRPLRLSFSPGALVKGAALVLKSEALVPVNLLEESQNRTLLFAGELTVT